MSDIASRLQVAQADSQLPVSWYFDEKIFELEKRLIFDAAARYVGHALMVPELNDYRSLEWHDHSRCWSITPMDSTSCRTSAVTARRSCSRVRAMPRTSSVRSTAGPTTTRALCSAPAFCPEAVPQPQA